MSSFMKMNGWPGVLMLLFSLPLDGLGNEPPNFVVIMVDDMGYGDLGCYGGTAFATPHLDRMAADGLRFTDFHSNGCVCSPTRAALLTGRYQQRAGVDGVIYAAFGRNRHHGLQRQEVTFAETLGAAGYATGCFGKWHLGYEEPYNPVHQGFDEFVGYVSGNVDFHTHIDGAGVFDWWHQNRKEKEEGYTTHLISSHACQFIRNAAAASTPFCVYVAHEAPHDPYQGPDDQPVRQEGQGRALWNHREPQHARRAYAEMVREMDRGVGDILDTLRQAGVDRNTLVLFFSDNGATGPGSNGVLYGMKASLWEGGHRVPAVAYWPGQIEAGRVTDQLACTMDVMPTLLELADVSAPSDRTLDGTSLVGVLRGAAVQPRTLFWKFRKAVSMRQGPWKLVVDGGGRPRRPARQLPQMNWDRPEDGRERLALFDLSQDLSEQHNLADQQPQRVAQMQQELQQWLADVSSTATVQPE